MERHDGTSGVQRAAAYFAGANLLIGSLGLFGPAVVNEQKGLINTRPGYLLGLAAIDPVHALVHLGTGGAGLVARRDARASRGYMRAVAVLYGMATVMGVQTVGRRKGIEMMMGMAVDRRANYVHALWTAFALTLSVPQPRRNAPLPRPPEPLPIEV